MEEKEEKEELFVSRDAPPSGRHFSCTATAAAAAASRIPSGS
jgi:hypothetical protein